MDARLIAAVSGSAEGLNVAGLCRQLGISRQSFYKWRARYAAGGLAGLEERSRRPGCSPQRVAAVLEDVVIEYRKRLMEQGLDAGPATIRWHLLQAPQPQAVPSEATLWRILVRRGFVSPQPSKRPKGSCCRFEAGWPNERWQADHTEWTLADRGHTVVQILNLLDDHSRLCVASQALPTVTSAGLWDTFSGAGVTWGFPASCLSDNGLVFSGKLRGFEVDFEIRLRQAGIVAVTSRPFHPQTCGKIERFQQTLKKWLRARRRHLKTLAVLNAALDDFVTYYNHQRPHRGIGRATPYSRWSAQAPAAPQPQSLPRPVDPRAVRSEHLVNNGSIGWGRHTIYLGAAHTGRTVHVVARAGGHLAVYHRDQLIRTLLIDPARRYQAWPRNAR